MFDLPIQKLANDQDRSRFACEVESLNLYLRERAGQDVRKKVAAVYVQLENDGQTISGYYTLASTSLNAGELPVELAKKLPKYPRLPTILIGRLARDQRHQRKGLGERLLLDALCRGYQSSTHVAATAVIVEADNPQAASFYKGYGFVPFPDQPHRLFIMMETVARLHVR